VNSAMTTAFAVLTLCATGCASTALSSQPTTARRDCTPPGAYVVSPPTSQHGFLTPAGKEPRVQTVGTVELEQRGVSDDVMPGVAARTATDTSHGRGDATYCF
jgi:hypothetical protein